MADLTIQWICLGETPEVLWTTQATLPDNSMYPLAAPLNPPPGIGSAANANTFYQFAFWNAGGNLIYPETALVPLGTQPLTATAWYYLKSNPPYGYSYACSVPWFSLGEDRPFVNEDSDGWQSPILTVDGQPWNDEPSLDTDDSAHEIVLKNSIDNQWFHSVFVIAGTAQVSGSQIHVEKNAKSVWALAFYEPFAQAQFQNLKQVLKRIRLPWKNPGAPAARDVQRLSNLITTARRVGAVSPATLRELSAAIKRIKVPTIRKQLEEIEEMLFLLEAAQFLSARGKQGGVR